MDRSEARETAFKALFQLDFTPTDEEEFYENLAIENAVDVAIEEELTVQQRRLTYIENTVKGTRANLTAIDEIIAPYLKTGWTIERLATADRNILRLAVYEMHFAEKPVAAGVAINEAVELAKKYGAEDSSSRFINAVLNAIHKSFSVEN